MKVCPGKLMKPDIEFPFFLLKSLWNMMFWHNVSTTRYPNKSQQNTIIVGELTIFLWFSCDFPMVFPKNTWNDPRGTAARPFRKAPQSNCPGGRRRRDARKTLVWYIIQKRYSWYPSTWWIKIILYFIKKNKSIYTKNNMWYKYIYTMHSNILVLYHPNNAVVERVLL